MDRSKKLEKALIDIVNHTVPEDEWNFDSIAVTYLKAKGYDTLKEIAQEGLND